MRSTFFGLDIASSGMQTYQTALNTVAHNLANVGTAGYSRQLTNTSASTPLAANSTYGMIGTGVLVTDISRQRNEYYDTKYRISSSVQAKYTVQSYYLRCFEKKLYAEDSDTASITNTFDQFYTSITDLTSDPTDLTKRTQVVSDALSFADEIRETAGVLQTLQEEANTEIKASVEQINSLAERIASLTKQINSLEAFGGTANDLRDQRGVLLDELSVYANIETKEVAPADGIGYNQFIVYLNGETLVDTTTFNTLICKERTVKDNINDIDHLYSVEWSNGQVFNERSSQLGGALQALFEFRDGNNAEVLQGKFTDMQDSGGVVKVTLTDANINALASLNIPDSNGSITIGGFEYAYESFEVTVGADGKYSYTFTLKDNISTNQKGVLANSLATGKSQGVVGESVNSKGVPYYMAQLNEFVRTFSERFNEVHNAGYDADSKAGLDFFNAQETTSGANLVFTEKGSGYDASFTSLPTVDADGNYIGSYYHMTALNFSVHKEVELDPNKVACKSEEGAGNGEGNNIRALMKLKDDSKMFLHGTPDSFLQCMTSAIGVDSKKADVMSKSQANILKAIDNQRESVSGVDEDEEAADLIKLQNLLFNQYKVLSVMDEIYDKLINGTAV